MLKTIARGLAGLLLAGAIVFALFAHQGAGWRWLISGGWHSSARIAALTPEEQTWAAIAWRYFVNNTQPQTGLVNGSDKQPRVTLWQMGDTLIAQPVVREELRLGESEYAATAFQLWGFSPEKAFTPPAHHVIIAQRRLAVDARDPRTTWQPSLITTLPYMLPGLEFGWEPEGVAADRQKHLRKQAENVWLSQKSRWETDKILTARADFSLPQAPWHIQDTVWGNGYAWNSVGDDGRDYTRFAQVSTKAVFALWALWDTPYTDVLMAVTKHLNDPQKGWYEGRQEATGDTNAALTLSTNATVLEALFFKHNAGPLFDARRAKKESYFTRRVADDYTPVGHCLPGENAVRRTP